MFWNLWCAVVLVFIPLQCFTSLFFLSVTSIRHMLDLFVTSSNFLSFPLHFPIFFHFDLLSLPFSLSLPFYASFAVIVSPLIFQSICWMKNFSSIIYLISKNFSFILYLFVFSFFKIISLSYFVEVKFSLTSWKCL